MISLPGFGIRVMLASFKDEGKTERQRERERGERERMKMGGVA